MILTDEQYYGIESLLFLFAFDQSAPWRSDKIAAVISLGGATKELLKDVNPRTPICELQARLEKLIGLQIQVEDQSKIKAVLGVLHNNGLVIRKSRGFKISDSGKRASLYTVATLFEPVALAKCTYIDPPFDCPKAGSNVCCSYGIYNNITTIIRTILNDITIEDIVAGVADVSDTSRRALEKIFG